MLLCFRLTKGRFISCQFNGGTTFANSNTSAHSTFSFNEFSCFPCPPQASRFPVKCKFIKTTFIKKNFSSKTTFIKNQFHQSTSCQRDPPPEQKQYGPCLCESVAGKARDAFTQTRFMPTFGVSAGLFVEHCRVQQKGPLRVQKV